MLGQKAVYLITRLWYGVAGRFLVQHVFEKRREGGQESSMCFDGLKFATSYLKISTPKGDVEKLTICTKFAKRVGYVDDKISS